MIKIVNLTALKGHSNPGKEVWVIDIREDYAVPKALIDNC